MRFRSVRAAAAVAGLLPLLAALSAQAACLTDAEVAAMVAARDARQPAVTPLGLSAADAACSRKRLNESLEKQLGKPVGYKAGLTNPAVQKRFNASEPVWGVLYAPMMLKDGATVDAAFGARPLYEADMLVRVKSASINHARTPEEVLQHVDQVIPAIELPDLVVQAPGQLDGAGVSAINVGARLFVTGAPLAVGPTRGERVQWVEALRDMTVVLSADGAEVDRGKGSDVLGHPLQAVIWLAQDLQKNDLYLKPGDLVSLGSFSRLMPPKPGMAVDVAYWGLPGTPKVKVAFK